MPPHALGLLEGLLALVPLALGAMLALALALGALVALVALVLGCHGQVWMTGHPFHDNPKIVAIDGYRLYNSK